MAIYTLDDASRFRAFGSICKTGADTIQYFYRDSVTEVETGTLKRRSFTISTQSLGTSTDVFTNGSDDVGGAFCTILGTKVFCFTTKRTVPYGLQALGWLESADLALSSWGSFNAISTSIGANEICDPHGRIFENSAGTLYQPYYRYVNNELVSDFTEVDPNSHLTVSGNVITASAVDFDERVYLYKDYGADYWNALDLEFWCRIDSSSEVNAYGGVALTESVVGSSDQFGSYDIYVFPNKVSSSVYGIYFYRGLGSPYTSQAIDADTWYRVKITRAQNADTVYFSVWNAAGAQVGSTKSLTGYGTHKYRYLYNFCNYYTGATGSDFDGTIGGIKNNLASYTHKVGLLESTDAGVNWSVGPEIYSGTTKYTEPAVAHIGAGNLVCLCRADPTGACRQFTSDDDGATWSAASTTNVGNSDETVIPHLYFDSQNSRLLAAIKRRNPTFANSKMLLYDADPDTVFNSATAWPLPLLIPDDVSSTAGGYPWIESDDPGDNWISWYDQVVATRTISYITQYVPLYASGGGGLLTHPGMSGGMRG